MAMGKGAVLGGPNSAELEAIAAEGERRSAIAVLHTAWSTHGGLGLGIGSALLGLVAKQCPALNDRIDVLLETGAGIEGDDGRRGFLGAKAVVIPRMSHGASHELIVLHEPGGEASDAGGEEQTGLVGFARVEEVEAGVRAH